MAYRCFEKKLHHLKRNGQLQKCKFELAKVEHDHVWYIDHFIRRKLHTTYMRMKLQQLDIGLYDNTLSSIVKWLM